jgi:hypothetical protein
MKTWSFVVAGLYAATLVVLAAPFAWSCFAGKLSWSDAGGVLASWQFAGLVFLMAAAQFALLRVPVDLSSRRPRSRGPLLATVLSAAFMMGVLGFGLATSVYEWTANNVEDRGLWIGAGVALASWAAWAVYFHRITRDAEPDAAVPRLQRFLKRGSILELLVAVPTHVVARHREYCCAGVMTFFGLSCGVAVMLFAFGPAVYFLFAERWRRLHPQGSA